MNKVKAFNMVYTIPLLICRIFICTVCSTSIFSDLLPWGRLLKAGLALTMGKNSTHCFSLCVLMHPFLLKLVKRKLQLIQERFLKNIFKFTKKGLEKFALNFKLTQV